MLKRIFITKAKSKAQGLLEFALVIPILLMVIYGVIETSRVIFIFGSVHTASRQAVRYGSAIGLVDTDDDKVIDTPRFEDCAGITAAANKVAFITNFSNVNITYDRGLNPDGTVKDITGIDPDPSEANTCTSVPSGTVKDRDRISVYVSAQFSPIINIIPFDPLTIESTASRTILGQIPIFVTGISGSWSSSSGTGTPLLTTRVDTDFSDVFDEPDDIVHFIFKLENVEEDDLIGPYTITEYYLGGGLTYDCSAATSPLAQFSETFCTGTYSITQANLDAGSITVLTVATTLGGDTSNEDYLNIDMDQDPDLDMDKDGSPSVALSAGDDIDYTYTLFNDGNITLTGPFSISDDKVDIAGSVDCSGATDPLPPGATTICSGSYVITAADIAASSVTNYAIATANEAVSDLESFKVITNPLLLTVSASPNPASTVGELISFTYTLTNVGLENLQSPYNVSATHLGVLDSACSEDPISPEEFMQCTSTYTVTQADIDNGSFTNVATATAKLDGEIVSSNDASTEVELIQIPVLEITSITTDPVSPVTVEGTVVTYSYTIQNNGNVSLSNLTITDELNDNITNISCDGATDPLAPGASTNCSSATPVTYIVDADALADGSIVTDAFANATFGTGSDDTSSNNVLTTVITYTQPRITLELTSSHVGASPGEAIDFTYKIRNTGDTAFSGFTLTEIVNPGVTFNPTCISTPIDIGSDVTCTANYTITDDDQNNGSVVATWEASAPEASLASSSTVTVFTYICIVSITNIQTDGDSFYATISSNETLTLSYISVTWNNLNGHQIGADKTLRLVRVGIESPSPSNDSSYDFNPANPSGNLVIPDDYINTPPTIEDGSQIYFTFHQSYDNQEVTDTINIKFINPNCLDLVATP